MQSIRAVAAQQLYWVQPKMLILKFELRAGNDLLGTFHWRGHSRSALTTAELADATLTFQRKGIFRPRVVIGGGPDDVVFTHRWNGDGTLTFPDGRVLTWDFLDFAYRGHTWKTANGTRLIGYRTTSGFLKNGGQITIEPSASSLPDLTFLVAFGCYLTIKAHSIPNNSD